MEEGEVGRHPESLGLTQILDVPVLGLLHDDLRPGVLEEAKAARVVGVQVALDDVPEVIRPPSLGLEPGQQARLRSDLAEVDELLPRFEPFGRPLRGDAGVPQEQPVRVLDHVAQDRASQPVLRAGPSTGVQDQVGVREDGKFMECGTQTTVDAV